MTRLSSRPHNEVTLRSTMNRVLLMTLGLVAAVTMGILFAYAQIKQTVSTRSIQAILERDTEEQISALLPSLLIPEQQSGAAILLDRFKAADELESISLLAPGESLPVSFSTCRLGGEAAQCFDDRGQRIAYVAPIREGNRDFGHLMKVKALTNPLANDTILHMIEAASVSLVLVFLGLFLFSSRLTARMIPDELSNLARWVEAVLADESSAKAPHLRFKELNDLADQIGEILERHDKARDQAVIGQLTSGIMHDIRTPIAPIVAAHLLVEEQGEGTEKRLSRLENLFRACKTNLPIIGNLIESTLDGSREIHVDWQPVDLRETINRALELIGPRARARTVGVELDYPISPLVVPHDPNQIIRVVMNLIRNGIDAIDDARAKTPQRLARIKVSAKIYPDGSARISVEDSGLGLPADTEKVFRVFRSSKPRGSGLGLIISRKIVVAHGGTLTATRSEVLGGARFDIHFPPSTTGLAHGLTVNMEAIDTQETDTEIAT